MARRSVLWETGETKLAYWVYLKKGWVFLGKLKIPEKLLNVFR